MARSSAQRQPTAAGSRNAATIYHHMEVPIDTQYQDATGRPRRIQESGDVVRELL